jgi:transcriptional regulator with XRE-family HTH domain
MEEMNFGRRLQRAIDELGISQAEFGRRVGVSAQSVNGWCQAGILPRTEILELLPKNTGKPLYWFFMSDEEEGQSHNDARSMQVNIPLLNDRQVHLIQLFEQLPTDEEQERTIEMISLRLNELDKVMAAYLKKRKIEPPSQN